MGLAQKKPAAAPIQPTVRRLRKSDLLFAEGEHSRAMYYIKTGMIRIFKKKGANSVIEIDTIRSGQILGELAFLDGNPRSASAEALTQCELVEISGQTFTQTLGRMPDWLKLLLKTVVGRLRTASTRIRQLEQASTSFDYSGDGQRAANYIFLNNIDILKSCSAVLLTSAVHGIKEPSGTRVKMRHVNRYGNQIMGIPTAKISTVLDALAQAGLLKVDDATTDEGTVLVTDAVYIEKFIQFFNEQNLLEPSKRSILTLKGFLIMGLIAKELPKCKKDEQTGLTVVNLANILTQEQKRTGREPFRLEDFPELVDGGYATNVNIKTPDDVRTQIKSDEFLHHFKIQKTIKTFEAVNEEKSQRRS